MEEEELEESNLSLLLGFKETAMTTSDCIVHRPGGLKLVPWLSWDEWDSVRDFLFSSCPHSIASALRRITAWRSRGCLPVLVEVTASIVEIQQKDPFFRADLVGDASDSDEMLAMLYCMAIMRLVNGVVEKTRKKTEVSIAEAADAINIPRMLIDIRHEGSHRDLPSIRLVRVASIKALDWLKSYYWEPQKKAILSRSDGTASLRKEIKSKLCEWAFCLKTKQDTRSSSSLAKGKPRIKHCEPLCGRNKFLSLVAGKPQSSKSAGSKKQITKALKHLVRLYSSYSSEVVSVLIELLLKGSDSSDSVGLPENYQDSHNTNHLQSVFDDWRLVIAKLSKKEPELLLTLTKAVLEMIETAQAMEYESGERAILKNTAEAHNIERLWCLFDWLVGNLKGLKPLHRKDSAAITEGFSADISLPKVPLTELLRKSLLVSCPGKNQLRGSALILAHLIGNSCLYEKLSKLCLLGASNPTTFDEDNSSIISSESILSQQEDSIHQAAEKLERFKLRRMKRKVLKTTDGDLGNNKRWVLAKSWNSCPIGMLPRDVGSSGCLPVLDCDDDHCKAAAVRPLESKEQGGLNECTRKRGPNIEVELLNYSHVKKKMRENEDGNESEGKDFDDDDMLLSEGIKGQLMIGGVWKKVGEEELLSIASAVRILV